MSSDIEQAIRQICDEKGLSYEAVIETIEAALGAAYRKDYGNKMQNLEAEFDPSTGGVRLFDVKTVVDDVDPEELEKMQTRQAEEAAAREAENAAENFRPRRKFEEDELDGDDQVEGENEITFNPKTEIMYSDARVLKLDVKIDDIIRTELPLPGEFGRMAAMTAKQVITQKLREAEREIVFGEFKEQEGEVLIGTVQRREGRVVLVDLGRTTGILLPEDQVRSEQYNSGDRIKVLVREVSLGTRGPQILLSRSSEELVRILFDLEIPEISEGTVEIKTIAREAGARSKVAVHSTDNSIDPIGACIGQRGIRIQTIINELGGEKIDIIEWSDDPRAFITNALAPAKVTEVEINTEESSAIALVNGDQLSLAIGRGGQNVRLAAKLTGWKLSVRDEGGDNKEEEELVTDEPEVVKEEIEDHNEDIKEDEE
ncbi:transcription termination factor NusA [Patescibacteria group bacterium]|nr:transcription termination factor NusA [Patescibacteria group bacterium]